MFLCRVTLTIFIAVMYMREFPYISWICASHIIYCSIKFLRNTYIIKVKNKF